MKKYYIVVGKKKKSVYMWDYVENEYYEFTSTNKSGFNFYLYNVIEVDSDKYEVLRNSSVVKIDPKDAKAIGKTDLKLFLGKMEIILGWRFATFEDLFNQRKEKRRIISLVKFSGSTITNGQLRIKHKEDYSYCDILDIELKNKEGFEYNGIALVEYIPDKRKERSFNLIFSIKNSFKLQKKEKRQLNSPNLMINFQDGDTLRSMFSANKKYYEELDILFKKEQEEIDKKIDENFMLMDYDREINEKHFEEYYEEYIDEYILKDIINYGFDDWNETSSIDIFEEFDYYDELDCLGFAKIAEDKEEHKGLAITKNNPYIYLLDKLLGNFKIYIENNIESKTFATNNKYSVINLLHPYGIECITNELYEVSNFKLDVLAKYDIRARNILDRFKNYLPSISIPSLVSIHNQYTLNDDEDIPF